MNTVSSEKVYEIIRSPLVSEKATFISQFNYYVFKVSPNSKKSEIKEAIEKIFNVKVKSVNTLNQKGKKKVGSFSNPNNALNLPYTQH